MADVPKDGRLTADLHRYLVEHGTPPDAVLRELAGETARLGASARMQISPEQGAFMTLLTRAIGARRAVEVGTFTGYSALCIARGLPPDGRLLCCDVSEEWTQIARRHWQQAGVADRIELRLAPAAETLRALPDEPELDHVFIDADKGGYPLYYEESLKRLRRGGVVLVDNVLWMGKVADPSDADEQTEQIRRFNELVAEDERVDRVMLPIADGLTIARKR